MKRMRRLFGVAVIAALLCCCLGLGAGQALAAEAEPAFVVGSGSGGPGEDVSVTIDISNNPGICTCYIQVHYDSGLTLKSVTDGGLLVGPLFGGDKTANPYTLSWDDSANFEGNNFANGTLVTLTFTVDENAAPGEYAVWVTCDKADIYNLDLEEFQFATVAGKVTVTGGACSHTYTNYVSNGDATCGKDGTKTAQCDNGCGASDTKTDKGSALSHSYTNYVSNGDATCGKDGTKTAQCDNGCGTSDTKTDKGSALSHSYTNYVSNGDGSCDKAGTETAHCDHGCGATDIRENAALGHSYTNYVSNGDATCGKDGTKTAQCDNGCGTSDTKTDKGSALSHSYTNYVSNGDAACGKDGTETAQCDRGCGQTDIRTAAGTALDHSYGQWTLVKKATCGEEGQQRRICTREGCADEQTRQIPAVVCQITGLEDGVWTLGSQQTVSVSITGDYGAPESIELDGVPCKEAVFGPEQMNALAPGAHTLTIRYELCEAVIELEVAQTPATEPGDDGESIPTTGDAKVLLWVLMAAAAAAWVAVLRNKQGWVKA